MVTTRANTPMVFELVSNDYRLDIYAYISAFIILPKNGTGRADNTTWDDEYTLVVSDW
jgi:hypothetical protein